MAIYYQLFNAVVTLFIAVKVGLNWWLILLAVPAMIIAYLFEIKFGITAEMDILWRASDEWKEFKKQDEQFKAEVRKQLGIGS